MSSVLKLPPLADRYTWEAERENGEIIRMGDDLRGCVRVSLIPAAWTGLARHDLVGLKFVRRFLRQFKRSTVGGFDHASYWREVEKQQGPARAEARAARAAKGIADPKPPAQASKPQKGDEVLSIIVTEHARYHVRHSDGTVFVSPPDYELYL